MDLRRTGRMGVELFWGDAEAQIGFGVLFSDPSGMQTVARAYWSNRDTNIVTDISSEARLAPGNWGLCRFGK